MNTYDSEFWLRGEQELDFENPGRAPSPPKPAVTPLKRGEVADTRIVPPAQQALVRLSTATATRPDALALLDHVKQGRITSIVCMNSPAAEARAKRLGVSPARAIRIGEDAVVLLDPNDLRQGTPMIAFRPELDPMCGPPLPKRVAQPVRMDAALRRALAGFEAWRAGIQLGRTGKCALAPLDDPRKTVPATSLAGMTAHPNVLPRMLCAATAVAALPGTPIQVRHRHQPRDCNLTFSFVDDGGVVDMLPANMNPRFILPDDSVSVHAPLQTKLVDLLFLRHRNLLAPRASATDRDPKATDRLRVALVDLTGRKLCQPQFAGYGESFAMPGASTAKILLVYAAFQVIFDLQQLARLRGLRFTPRSAGKADPNLAALAPLAAAEWPNFTCPPNLAWLCAFSAGPGGVLNVTRSAALDSCLGNVTRAPGMTPRANELLMRLGFEYVASVSWQSGLRHPTRGGIWFGGSYCQVGKPAGFDARCATENKNDPDCTKSQGESRVVWNADPLGIKAVQGTALAFATYMTLLAQGRLVDAASSTEIERLLLAACNFAGRAVPVQGALPALARLPGLRATKCGDTSQLFHDATLFEAGGRRWVVSFVTKGLTNPERFQVLRLVHELRDLIHSNPP